MGPGFSPRLAGPGRRGAPAKSPAAVRDTGGSARGTALPRVAPPAKPGTREGGSGQWPFLPGEPAEGGPALLPVPPTAARARRPLGAGSRARPGRANLGRSHHGEFKRTRGARPCPVAGRTGKVSVRRGSLGARDRSRRLERTRGGERAAAGTLDGRKGAGTERAGSPESGWTQCPAPRGSR